MSNYVVVGQHPWNKSLFKSTLSKLPGTWIYCETSDQYKSAAVKYSPRYVFFLHWSKMVSEYFTAQYECVCFHPTDLPYGRGGTPIQNLILRGHTYTKISAFRMNSELDAGPVYCKRNLSLNGDLRDIFEREMFTVGEMIKYIIDTNPEPVPQEGEIVEFARRKPEESEIPKDITQDEFYDHVRMVDAEGYPPARITLENVIIEFSKALRTEAGYFVSGRIRKRQ